MAKIIHQPADKFAKKALKDKRVACDFFKAHLPPALFAQIDQTQLTLIDKEFIDEQYKASCADIVYCAPLKDSTVYLSLLFEHQSQIDSDMPFRLLGYMTRIMQDHRQQYPKTPLPLVYPLVVYSGEKNWNASMDLFDAFGDQGDWAKQLLFGPYHLLDLQKTSDDALRARPWSGILEFALKHRVVRDFRIFLTQLLPWLHELEVDNGGNLAKNVITYIINGVDAEQEYLLIEEAKNYLSNELQGEIMTLAQRFEERGLAQGMQQGQQQTLQLMVKKMLNKGLDRAMVADLSGLTTEAIEALANES